jgi:hypothetical protein
MDQSIEASQSQTQGKPADGYPDNLTVSTVNVREVIGTIFLGVISIILLILLIRTYNRYEALLRKNILE